MKEGDAFGPTTTSGTGLLLTRSERLIRRGQRRTPLAPWQPPAWRAGPPPAPPWGDRACDRCAPPTGTYLERV